MNVFSNLANIILYNIQRQSIFYKYYFNVYTNIFLYSCLHKLIFLYLYLFIDNLLCWFDKNTTDVTIHPLSFKMHFLQKHKNILACIKYQFPTTIKIIWNWRRDWQRGQYRDFTTEMIIKSPIAAFSAIWNRILDHKI